MAWWILDFGNQLNKQQYRSINSEVKKLFRFYLDLYKSVGAISVNYSEDGMPVSYLNLNHYQ
jgi:hypothetical protein